MRLIRGERMEPPMALTRHWEHRFYGFTHGQWAVGVWARRLKALPLGHAYVPIPDWAVGGPTKYTTDACWFCTDAAINSSTADPSYCRRSMAEHLPPPRRQARRGRETGKENSVRYRKKPVVIEAVQYTGLNVPEALAFVNDEKVMMFFPGHDGGELRVRTLESKSGESLIVSAGDWIIKGVKGEFYPCKPDIFETTYEVAE